jgi:hypothetical protein
MQVLDHPTAAAPLNVSSLIRRQRLSGSDKTTLTSTCQRIAKSLDLIESSRPNAAGHYGRLQAAADVAEREAAGNPTPESVERLHLAVVRASQATTTFDRINVALNVAIRREIDSLAPLANRLLDSTGKSLDDEGQKRMKEIVQSDAIFGEGGDSTEFQRRLDATRASLADERQAVNRAGAALAWLVRFEFSADPFRDPSEFLGADAEPEDIDREMAADMH